jgi:hypothetical protein
MKPLHNGFTRRDRMGRIGCAGRIYKINHLAYLATCDPAYPVFAIVRNVYP